MSFPTRQLQPRSPQARSLWRIGLMAVLSWGCREPTNASSASPDPASSPPAAQASVTVPNSSLPEPFAYCREAGTTATTCPECIVSPGSTLGRALSRAGRMLTVAWRCQDGEVTACELGASGRACRIVTSGRDQMAAMEKYCKEQPGTRVPNAVNYSAAEWRCDGSNLVRDELYPEAETDKLGYVAGNWRFVRISPEDDPSHNRPASKSAYEDAGACPFECCTYRSWLVKKTVRLHERRSLDSPVLEEIEAGTSVQALTGVVVTVRSGRATVLGGDPSAEAEGWHFGEQVEVLTYRGEGYWLVRSNGRMGELSLKPDPAPESEWWIRVRAPSGWVGWTNTPENFDVKTMDSCS